MNKIKLYRELHSLSQEDLAFKIKVNSSAISHIELGNREVSRDMARSLNELDADYFPLPDWLRLGNKVK